MKEEYCQVEESIHLTKKYYLLKIKSEYISSRTKPGHFLMISVSSSHDPLLKRPFGILDSDPPYIWIYYEVVGRGTELLSKLQKKDQIMVLGPLGNSFPELKKKNVLLIAGGRGIAHLVGHPHILVPHAAADRRVDLLYAPDAVR